jgi:cytochrome c peroxidase
MTKLFGLLASTMILGFIILRCSSGQDFNAGLVVPTPIDNPQSMAKIALGRQLFFDKRLSLNETIACASCHDPQKAFTDQLPKSKGINGQLSERNAPSILNAAFLKTAMFDAHLASLELQAIVPIQETVEMGHNMKLLIQKLRKIPEYQAAAQSIFNRDFDAYVLTRSIAAFERSLLSMNAPFDRYLAGEKKALTADQKAGWKIFSEKLYCTQCHPAPYFTTYVAANNGLYASYEGKSDQGRFRIHHDSTDIGKFKIPSLRNIPLTYPYMHDGSFQSLEQVLAHYQKGAAKNPLQDARITSFILSPTEKKQLLAFFDALIDTSYLKRDKF